jgi:hypothetical protein
MISSFPVGTGIRIRAEFRNEAGDLQDPDNVTLRIVPPSGVAYEAAPQSTVVGVWTYVLLLDTPGDYRYTFAGTGELSATGNGVVAATEDLAA